MVIAGCMAVHGLRGLGAMGGASQLTLDGHLYRF
jgi:hypothetical protein